MLFAKKKSIPFSRDERGSFLKTFSENVDPFFQDFSVKDSYLTISNKNVIRGMHFQLPPYDHDKIVICTSGEAIDLVVDLRKDSPNYKKVSEFNISGDSPEAVLIPKGYAHGFLSLEDNTGLLYQVNSPYAPKHDAGILWSSIDYFWGEGPFTHSGRDVEFTTLDAFESPF